MNAAKAPAAGLTAAKVKRLILPEASSGAAEVSDAAGVCCNAGEGAFATGSAIGGADLATAAGAVASGAVAGRLMIFGTTGPPMAGGGAAILGDGAVATLGAGTGCGTVLAAGASAGGAASSGRGAGWDGSACAVLGGCAGAVATGGGAGAALVAGEALTK